MIVSINGKPSLPCDSRDIGYFASLTGWHGCFGHANILTLDHESVITGYGKHNRVICFLPDYEGLMCRVDHIWQLPIPTIKQILTVARKDQGVKGKWQLYKEESNDGSTWYFFKKAV